MEDPGESLEDALLFALDDLRGENFKRFKSKLCFLNVEGKDRIPRGKLENVDTVDLTQLLLENYGEEGAREVAVEVLKKINMRDSATRLQKWESRDCKKKYTRHIQDTFWRIPELGSPAGPKLSLQQRYTELLLSIRKPHPEERAHELVAVERKHWEMEAHPESFLTVGMEKLFDPEAVRKSPRTVVLFGPAGVGKTTSLWKLMLDWASGKFCQAKFAYAFYISCRTLNNRSGAMSLVDLIVNSGPPGTLLLEDILMNQDNLLLVLDGFDELKLRDLPSDGPSNDLHKKQPVAHLVIGLLKKKLLAKCHLIVATRPGALGPLLQNVRLAQCVEVLGFHPAQRKEYFQRFFEDKEDGARAFELVRSNKALFSMCFLPISCLIICSILSRKPQGEPFKDIPERPTSTDLHMWLLLKFLGSHSTLSNLEGLCRLAKEGLLRKTIVFDEEALKEHGLENISASSGILLQDAHIGTIYRFIHLSFQEFFAALSFHLLDSDGNAITSFQELNEVFGNKKEYSSNCLLFVRFLFGLSNKKRLNVLRGKLGCKTSEESLLQELGRWVEQEAGHHSFKSRERLLELCHCLYETEDLQFAKSIMEHVHDLDLKDQLASKLDFTAVSFCLLAADSFQSLRLSDFELGPKWFGQLLPGLLKPSEIQLNRCGLTAAMCKDLASILVANPNLTSLDLSENPLDDFGIIQLHDGLLDSHCKLQSLRLDGCHLTAAACEPLSLVLASNQCLAELSLGDNRLGDGGIRKLCEGLKHPQSKLQRLTLNQCNLTAAACMDLASVLETSQTLMELYLGDNNLGDEGIRQLCAVLKTPCCKLRRLALTMGSLNRFTKIRLQTAASAHPEMILTSYYSPSYLAFPGEED